MVFMTLILFLKHFFCLLNILSFFSIMIAEGEGCKITLREKVEIVRLYSLNEKNMRQNRWLIYQNRVKEQKSSECGMEKVPINKMFDEMGCVSKSMLQGRTRKRTVKTAANIFLKTFVVYLISRLRPTNVDDDE